MKDPETSRRATLLVPFDRLKGWAAQLLGTGHSGEADQETERAGSGRVPRAAAPLQAEFTEAERKYLLELARDTLARVLTERDPPEVAPVDSRLAQKRACFVTLTKSGELRGCVGQILAQAPLYQAVMDNACGAALRDPRFPHVQAEEVSQLSIEISVLSQPDRLSFASPEDLLDQLHPLEDGVLLQINGRLATFLPQVWEQVPDKVEFLERLAQKAGCGASAWRSNDAAVSIYRVESFEAHGITVP
jgi:AmmeMemoRadiSam system protein A